MLNGLKLINYLPCAQLEEALRERAKGQVFILRTCQRTLVLGFNRQPERTLPEHQDNQGDQDHRHKITEVYSGLAAYEFLLQTICGLKSRVLGENEIVNQFKEAYGEFLKTAQPNRLIQTVLEKLFKDAKDIRTTHLKNIGLQSYAGITRKILCSQAKYGQRVLVLGSGQLSEDFIKISHRRFDILLCARNQERVRLLKDTYGVHTLDWAERHLALAEKYIVNTIGTETPFIQWPQNAPSFTSFIDLAEPSPFSELKGQKYYHSLEEIFDIGQAQGEEKQEKIEHAMSAIEEATKHRNGRFTINTPFGWDELLFA